MNMKSKVKKSMIVRVALIAFGAYLAYSMISFQVEINQKQETLAELKERYEEQLIANEELQRTLDTYGTNDFIERMAREKLGYAYADEHFYVDISGTK